MIPFYRVFLGFFLLSLASTAFAREMHYTVDLRDTKSHAVHVTLKPVGFSAKAAALFGYYDDDKNASSTVEYVKPSDWKLATALSSGGAGGGDAARHAKAGNFQITTFVAKNYDALADAPVMASPEMVVRTFRE